MFSLSSLYSIAGSSSLELVPTAEESKQVQEDHDDL